MDCVKTVKTYAKKHVGVKKIKARVKYSRGYNRVGIH